MTNLYKHIVKKTVYFKYLVLCFICFVNESCIEQFEPDTLTFDEILVIEAIITDEVKPQQIILSKTTLLENQELSPEADAVVMVADNAQNSYVFEETSPGLYVSTVSFGAEPDRDYSLLVQTSVGDSYTSEIVRMTGTAQIDDLRAVRKTNEQGIDGIEIQVDGSSNEGQVSFYKYQYEETNRIVSPFSSTLDLFIVSENPPIVETRMKTKEERICYNTVNSNEIILAKTQNLSANEISNLSVRFISSNDFVIRDRYSILVRQFTISRQANTFYENLKEFSDLENVFSQIQTGFIGGNISSEDNNNKKVIGLFEVSSVSSRRIFFDYDDFFPELNTPPFINECIVEELGSSSPLLVDRIKTGRYKYIAEDPSAGTYFISNNFCVDCTLLGTNVIPDFWED